MQSNFLYLFTRYFHSSHLHVFSLLLQADTAFITFCLLAWTKKPFQNGLCSLRKESALRPDFTSNLVRELAFGTPKFYIAPYDKINHGLVNMSSNCDVKSGLRGAIISCKLTPVENANTNEN